MRQPIFNARNAILFSLLTAFIAGAGWALDWLHDHMELSGFMLFCFGGGSLMIACGYVYDWLSDRHA
jgi:hypothetical protein